MTTTAQALRAGDQDALQPSASVPTEQAEKPVVGDDGWSWWASRNEEQYLVGPEDSREAVIEAATEDFDGEVFHIVEARKGSMSSYLPHPERVIEWMTEAADDAGAFGEDDYCELKGTPEAIAAAEADLKAILADWFARHTAIFPTPWAFAQTRNGEWIDPAKTTGAA